MLEYRAQAASLSASDNLRVRHNDIVRVAVSKA
jgi:hypothetical protein